jgi:beta-lactamase class A
MRLTLIGILLLNVRCKPHKTTHSIEALKVSITEVFNTLEGDFALAFVDLSNNKNTLLINADERFHAASTMKTPVMIEMYKQASEGKFSLSDSIVLKNEFKSIVDGSSFGMDISVDSDPETYNRIGGKVTLYDLTYDMITASSNLATNVLIDLLTAKKVTATMRNLGAKNIEVLRGVEDLKAFDLGLNNTTTAKDLMIIMRSIADGTAGNQQDCEEMIAILSDQNFNSMIPFHLPQEVQVAHKTGSITGVHHDSGIVFLPDGREYVLVILSKNLTDFEMATKEMSLVSKIIYDFMMQ